MATKEWMRQDRGLGPRDGLPRRPEPIAEEDSRSVLEIGLAVAGVAAWLWCAVEIARTLFR